MAGAGLIAIKRRIKSVTSTKKITKAMGLVATAKLRKTRSKLDTSQKYHNSYKDIIDSVSKNYPAEAKNIYTHGNGSKRKLYVIISSDSGFCGGFNSAVTNAAFDEIVKDKDNSDIFLVGHKGKPYLLKRKLTIMKEFDEIPDLPTMKEAVNISDAVFDLYEKNEVGEVYIVYTQYVSTAKQIVETNKILPLGFNSSDEYVEYIKFEPNVIDMISYLGSNYITEEVLNHLLNSKASEQGARMAAMDGATRNANEILQKLSLQYNRIRQGAITQEITEIIGGADAQK